VNDTVFPPSFFAPEPSVEIVSFFPLKDSYRFTSSWLSLCSAIHPDESSRIVSPAFVASPAPEFQYSVGGDVVYPVSLPQFSPGPSLRSSPSFLKTRYLAKEQSFIYHSPRALSSRDVFDNFFCQEARRFLVPLPRYFNKILYSPSALWKGDFFVSPRGVAAQFPCTVAGVLFSRGSPTSSLVREAASPPPEISI